MSTSPQDPHDEGADKQSVDELADPNHATDDAEPGEALFSFRRFPGIFAILVWT